MGRRRDIRIKRVYEESSAEDGVRLLVDGLWPRGVTKEGAGMERWAREVAPSAALRKEFGHMPGRWEEFCRRYFAELEARPEAWEPIVEAAGRGRVTLVYAARDEVHNNAAALREFLLRRG